MDVSMQNSSVASSVNSSVADISAEDSVLLSSKNEADAAATTGEKRTVAIKGRRNSVRKPRTRGLINKLQNQIEFYFGDANLPKDKYLQQKISENEDGYVAVDVVASFKKMRSLTTDKSLILQAIKKSSLLELSEDSKCLRRCQPLSDVPQSDIDQRTLYVENLPVSSTDHDSIKKMFKAFGDVTYVSLPRYKSSGAIKGFAFVEFSSQEAAVKAVEYFRAKEGQTVSQETKKFAKDDITSVEAMSDMEMDGSLKDNSAQDDGDGGDMVDKCMDGIGDGGVLGENGGDGKGVSGEGGGGSVSGEGVAVKSDGGVNEEGITGKREGDGGCVTSESRGDVASQNYGSKVSKRDKGESGDGGVTGESGRGGDGGVACEGGGGVADESDKDVLHKGDEYKMEEDTTSPSPEKAERMNRKRERDKDQTDDILVSSLPTKRSKKDEESTREELKVSCDPKEDPVAENKREGVTTDMEEEEEEEEEAGVVKNKGSSNKKKRNRNRQHRKKSASSLTDLNLRVMSKTEWIQMKEVFKNLQKLHMKQVKSKTEESSCPPPRNKGFVKESLVRVELEKKWEESEREKLKAACEQYGEVAYIDLKEGESTGYVRFKSSGCVTHLIDSTTRPVGMEFYAVKEEDERAYYLKTQAERKQRFVKDKRKMKTRGKEKLVSRALKKVQEDSVTDQQQTVSMQPTHIKFSDSETSDIECS